MKINEVFTSFQGEGPYTGIYATFLRLHGCNLKCSFCDTLNTKSFEYDLNTLLNLISQKMSHEKTNTLILTGGEPFLQYEEILNLKNKLPRTINLHIETNGDLLKYIENAVHVISPKSNIDSIFKYYFDKNNTFFKFIIQNEKDIFNIKNLIKKYNYRKNVFLQPEFSNATEIVKIILENGSPNFRLSGQLHKYFNLR
ncbi:MAG: 7-carboxy-7-deazaguanine synthase QueE [Methanobrevibacter sp.]|jgi:7-carboxy-7-deazaguanine synthase|nr:7-carboxy-7-deazaguanine synthase QueE [Methanobrevibacter sp.]